MTNTRIRLLSETERDRLVELIDIYNTATQVDRDESVEFQALLAKLLNDGEEALAATEQVLTVDEKLARIAASGWKLAYDGCHKIYFLEDAEREQQARENDYEIHDATEVVDLFRRETCGLQFVERWGLDGESWEHELNINQFEEED